MVIRNKRGTVSDITKDLRKLSPLALVRFMITALQNADPSRVVHGVVIEKDYPARVLVADSDGLSERYEQRVIAGLCGCAIGTIALADGKEARKDVLRLSHHERGGTAKWRSGPFAGWLLAATSREFERGAHHGNTSSPEEIARVVQHLQRFERALFTNRANRYYHTEPSRFWLIDSRFGTLYLS